MKARPFRETLDALPPERRVSVEARADAMIAEVENLMAVREMLGQTQAEVAGRMGASQASVSKIERRADVYVSTLRDLIRAMGGTLDVVARFPGREPVRIRQFEGSDLLPARGRKAKAKEGAREG